MADSKCFIVTLPTLRISTTTSCTISERYIINNLQINKYKMSVNGVNTVNLQWNFKVDI